MAYINFPIVVVSFDLTVDAVTLRFLLANKVINLSPNGLVIIDVWKQIFEQLFHTSEIIYIGNKLRNSQQQRQLMN